MSGLGSPAARETFESSIKDACDLLDHFDAQPKPPPSNAEVLKRAGLIMALTAWETYIEDRIVEVVQARIGSAPGSHSESFMLRHLRQELRRFNTPNSEKTLRLFREYADLDLRPFWRWNNYEPDRVSTELDALVQKRGEAVHRSKHVAPAPAAHLVKRDELERAIRFLRSLVDATEKAVGLVALEPPRERTSSTGG